MDEVQQIVDPEKWEGPVMRAWDAVTGYLGTEWTIAIIILLILMKGGAFEFWRRKRRKNGE